MSQTKYHRTWLKLHKGYEKYAYPIIKKALDNQIEPVIKMIDEGNFDVLETYLPYVMNTTPIREALFEIYPVIGRSAAEFSYDWITDRETKALSFFNAEWIQEMVDYFLLNAGNKIQGITDTTLKYMRSLLAESANRNLSRRDQAKFIQETLNDPAYNRNRALVIARTESTTAANKGIQVGAESSDYIVEKFWIATLDRRTRRDHMVASYQAPIPFNADFKVGVSDMAFPGDARGAADEVINCRCVLGTQAVKDSDGLPVLKLRSSRVEF